MKFLSKCDKLSFLRKNFTTILKLGIANFSKFVKAVKMKKIEHFFKTLKCWFVQKPFLDY